MFYIKLNENMDLVTTVYEPIYRGDNLNQKIIFLLPPTVGEIELDTASVYLSYIRSDGAADVVLLERGETMYREAYYQYTLPVTCKLSRYPGEVCAWIQIYSGTPSNPTVAKTGECTLYVQESKCMDSYFCDHQMTVLYQIQKDVEDKLSSLGGTGGSGSSGSGDQWGSIGGDDEDAWGTIGDTSNTGGSDTEYTWEGIGGGEEQPDNTGSVWDDMTGSDGDGDDSGEDSGSGSNDTPSWGGL